MSIEKRIARKTKKISEIKKKRKGIYWNKGTLASGQEYYSRRTTPLTEKESKEHQRLFDKQKRKEKRLEKLESKQMSLLKRGGKIRNTFKQQYD
jgi:hypothetical protein